MKGAYQIVVRNNKVQIKLYIKRNLTILQGKSATGKTTLLELIAAYDELGASSGVTVNCDAPCKVLSGRNWLRDLSSIENSIVFVDEDNALTSCGSISGHLVTIPYQIIKHIPTSALLEA